MDSKTQRIIQRLHRDMPKEYKRNMTEKYQPMQETREKLEELSRDKRVDSKKREALKKQLENPELHRTRERANPETEKKMDKWWGERMQNAIRSGQITPAKKDEWMKKRGL